MGLMACVSCVGRGDVGSYHPATAVPSSRTQNAAEHTAQGRARWQIAPTTVTNCPREPDAEAAADAALARGQAFLRSRVGRPS